MPFTLNMPKLSPTMEEGTIVKWHKKPNEFIEAGDLLLEVATDKATVEYNALDGGWLRQVLVQEGEEAVVNQPIAILTEGQNESLEGYQVPKQAAEESQAASKEDLSQEEKKPAAEEVQVKQHKGTALQQPVFVPEPPLKNYVFEYPTQTLEKRVFASPLAKKIAKEKRLDLATVKGSGPNGRIMKRDLEKAQPAGRLAFSHRRAPQEAPGTYEERPLSPMRKVIGQRLQEAKSFIPHFYVRQEIDAAPLISIREQLKQGEVKVSVNDLIVKACAMTLKEHPEVNTGFHSGNQTIIQFKTIDIAVAVALPNGLITPIVRHADFKNLGELAIEIRTLAQKAKEGKLEPESYKGGSFTISNLGMYGITDFQAILNPPQSAILAVGGIQDVPILKENGVILGKKMSLTLSVDHRVIDGVVAATFMQSLKKYLENPAVLLIN